MKTILKIQITQNYTIHCSYQNEQNIQTNIHLNPELPQEEYIPCISFNNNTISVCKEEEPNNIQFIQQWIEEPENNTTYQVQFYNKTYHFIPEVLFAFIIERFKKQIEHQFIIEETLVKIPTRDFLFVERIKTSLESIDLKNIEIEKEEKIDFDYENQGEEMFELMKLNQTIETYKRMFERAKEINPSAKEKLEEIDFNQFDHIVEESIEEEIKKRFTTKERTQMKLCKLDNYCLFIASRFFESLDDHINFIQVSKRMNGNIDKFHYNPISLNNNSLKLFTNIETLHIYKENDDFLEGGRISHYVNWPRISYRKYRKTVQKNEGKKIEFKNIVFTRKDTIYVIEKKKLVGQ